jgi:hypothetical protein
MSNKDQNQSLAEFEEYFLDEFVVHKFTLPNGKPMLYKGEPVIGEVCSPGSEKYVVARAKIDRDATKRVMQSIGKGVVAKKDDDQDNDTEARFLAEIVSLKNFPYPGGEFAVFKNAKLKYMADDVRILLSNLGNFFSNGKSD